MKIFVFLILIISALFGCQSEKPNVKQHSSEQSLNLTPLGIVNQRMESYNQHDFENFIQLYDDSVSVYTYPNKLLGVGVDNIASIFKPKFSSKSIQVEIVSQMNNGNYVINHEIVTENGKDTKYVSIYEVQGGLIKSVKFVRDH